MNNYQTIRDLPSEVIADRKYNTQVNLSYLLNYPQMNYMSVRDSCGNYNLSNKVDNTNCIVSYNSQIIPYVAQDVKPYAQSCRDNSDNAFVHWGCDNQVSFSYAAGG